jgi:hypothetical protein
MRKNAPKRHRQNTVLMRTAFQTRNIKGVLGRHGNQIEPAVV